MVAESSVVCYDALINNLILLRVHHRFRFDFFFVTFPVAVFP